MSLFYRIDIAVFVVCFTLAIAFAWGEKDGFDKLGGIPKLTALLAFFSFVGMIGAAIFQLLGHVFR